MAWSIFGGSTSAGLNNYLPAWAIEHMPTWMLNMCLSIPSSQQLLTLGLSAYGVMMKQANEWNQAAINNSPQIPITNQTKINAYGLVVAASLLGIGLMIGMNMTAILQVTAELIMSPIKFVWKTTKQVCNDLYHLCIGDFSRIKRERDTAEAQKIRANLERRSESSHSLLLEMRYSDLTKKSKDLLDDAKAWDLSDPNKREIDYAESFITKAEKICKENQEYRKKNGMAL